MDSRLSSTVYVAPDGGEKRIKHYSNRHEILLGGEGDFSFAVCLARAFGSATNLVATSLDSEAELIVKYPNAMGNVDKLRARGCIVMHGVNARSMRWHPDLSGKLFDRIVFNFPHAGFLHRECSLSQITLHQNLVSEFLSNAREMMEDYGEVHVTHKTAHPFSQWKIEELAEEVGLSLVEEETWFSIRDYPGYQNKRGDGPRSNETFPVGQCSTFIFGKKPTSLLNSLNGVLWGHK